MNRREILLGGAALALTPAFARAQGTKPLKIGVMNDMSSVYSDFQGRGSVIATQLAVEDYSAKLGVPVEIVSADHQNKPDIGVEIARKWFETDHVDVIMDLPKCSRSPPKRTRR
jgi:branched-chain amino acid transport system substrate-binding protein